MDKNELNNEVVPCTYGYQPTHRFIGSLNNIGDNGEKLTIVILSCNRSALTIKLLKSVKENVLNFKGTCLVADNGSEEKELKAIEDFIKDLPFNCEIVKFGQNYGVSGGRNKAVEYVKTEWLMNLDNDIYFVDNPISSINICLETFGAKFVNLPLLDDTTTKIFANGGHLYVTPQNDKMFMGGGSMMQQGPCNAGDKWEDSLGTFLFGGASVLNKQTFIEAGMFDENMFVGFEDYDLSISIFNKGLKIVNCGHAALVHDHKISSDITDVEYEKVRFSNEKILNSAVYFENKHHFTVWTEQTEIWLNNKMKELGVETKKQKQNKTSKNKPKIALVLDVDNWAFANISYEIEKYLSEEFEFKIISMSWLDNNIVKLFFVVQDCNLVHFFWRDQLSYIYNETSKLYLEKLGMKTNDFIEKYIKPLNITVSVYDHLLLSDEAKEIRQSIFKFVNGYYCSSEILKDIYESIAELKNPDCVITDGVDLDKFKVSNSEKYNNLENRNIVIGWVGNSKFFDPNNPDLKGVNTILKPAINELIKEGYPLEMYFADKAIRQIPHDKMPEYYSKIDLYICTSTTEGTPNPVLEAMASGVAVITTNVGIVKEALGKEQQKYILKERDKEELKKLIKQLVGNKEELKKLSEENLKQIKNWTWEMKCKDFKEFFTSQIKTGKK